MEGLTPGLNLLTLPSAAESAKEASLARRRYQKGSVVLQNGNWTGRYLEDVRLADGTLKRIHKRVFLGTYRDTPTEKMARRKLEPFLIQINDGVGKPKTIITLNEFLVRWGSLVGMPTTDSTRGFKSVLNKHLKPAFGNTQLSKISTEAIQRLISQTHVGTAHMRTILKSFRKIWKSAAAWGYVHHNPFTDLVLPQMARKESRYFTQVEICRILNAAPEPFKTLYWLLAQTGLRVGEVLALTWETLDLEHAAVEVTSSVTRGKIRENVIKTKAGKRVIPLSPRLVDHLLTFRMNYWRENPRGLVFVNKRGNPWGTENLRQDHLQPLLKSLGISKAGFHAFRHASATILSQLNAPMEIRRARMGHTEDNMTLIYTHVIPDRARQVAAGFDQYLLPNFCLDSDEVPETCLRLNKLAKSG